MLGGETDSACGGESIGGGETGGAGGDDTGSEAGGAEGGESGGIRGGETGSHLINRGDADGGGGGRKGGAAGKRDQAGDIGSSSRWGDGRVKRACCRSRKVDVWLVGERPHRQAQSRTRRRLAQSRTSVILTHRDRGGEGSKASG